MATIEDILKLVYTLTSVEQSELKTVLLNSKSKANEIEDFVYDERFTGGLVCPVCGCVGHVVRNGHRKDGKQRYLCKDCYKSFVSNTNSLKVTPEVCTKFFFSSIFM